MNWTKKHIELVFFVSGILALLFSFRYKSFLALLFALQLFTLAAGLKYKKILPASVVILSVSIALAAVEYLLGFYGPEILESKQQSNKSTHSGGDYVLNYFIRTDIGFQATPGVHSSIKSANSGEPIYNVNYTIGDDGFRITSNNNPSDKRINFLGDSLAVGEGLNDNQTLPFFVARQSRFFVKNFGFHGYGPHQALAILASKRDTRGNINFFLTGPWQAERSACVPAYTTGSPRYVLENGVVTRQGNCQGGLYSPNNSAHENSFMEKLFGESKTCNLVNSILTKIADQGQQLELYFAIIEQMNALSKERGQNFVIGYIKADKNWFAGINSNESVVQRFKSKGIRVIDMTLANSNEELDGKYYIHELDKHPSSLANEERARILLEALQGAGLN